MRAVPCLLSKRWSALATGLLPPLSLGHPHPRELLFYISSSNYLIFHKYQLLNGLPGCAPGQPSIFRLHKLLRSFVLHTLVVFFPSGMRFSIALITTVAPYLASALPFKRAAAGDLTVLSEQTLSLYIMYSISHYHRIRGCSGAT